MAFLLSAAQFNERLAPVLGYRSGRNLHFAAFSIDMVRYYDRYPFYTSYPRQYGILRGELLVDFLEILLIHLEPVQRHHGIDDNKADSFVDSFFQLLEGAVLLCPRINLDKFYVFQVIFRAAYLRKTLEREGAFCVYIDDFLA